MLSSIVLVLTNGPKLLVKINNESNRQLKMNVVVTICSIKDLAFLL
jgi:hypothetical protein